MNVLKKINVSLFLILSSIISFAQTETIHKSNNLNILELLIIYNHEYHVDSLNLLDIRNEDFMLIAGSSSSVFISKNLKLTLDASKNIEDSKQLSAWLSDPYNRPPSPKIMYKIYKKYDEGKIIFTERIPGMSFMYEENSADFHWQLDNESDSILGFNVQKATLRYGGRDWIAWFCPEIPLSDGPYKFCGLPGLILRVYDSRMHYMFEALSIEKNNDHDIVEPADIEYIQITREDFLKAKENFRSDIINRAKEAGLSSEAQQTAARNLQKKNNPIELR